MKKLTKPQAITVMAVGGLMLLLSIVIPAERETTGFAIKLVVGFLGVCVFFVGAWLRPMKAPKNPKE